MRGLITIEKLRPEGYEYPLGLSTFYNVFPSANAAEYVPADTGGNVTIESVNVTVNVVHTFTTSNIFSSVFTGDVEYLVVAGGGGGGFAGGGGGGAGGLLYGTNYPVVAGIDYTIQVGAGGITAYSPPAGTPSPAGGNSYITFSGAPPSGSITAVGGGGGGGQNGTGLPGGSAGGSGNPTSVSGILGQGNNGGTGTNTPAPAWVGGGGGGAGTNGSPYPGPPNQGGGGGNGIAYSISGSSVGYAGGGGGGCTTPGSGGYSPPVFGGGSGGAGTVEAVAGTANRGGGGGAGPSTPAPLGGKAGGSGVVILRYNSVQDVSDTSNLSYRIN